MEGEKVFSIYQKEVVEKIPLSSFLDNLNLSSILISQYYSLVNSFERYRKNVIFFLHLLFSNASLKEAFFKKIYLSKKMRKNCWENKKIVFDRSATYVEVVTLKIFDTFLKYVYTIYLFLLVCIEYYDTFFSLLENYCVF